METDLFVLVDQVLDPLPDPCPGGVGDDCFRIGFPIFFFDNGNSLPSSITVTNLQITGTVSGGTVDQTVSQGCAPSGYTVTVSNDGASFTYTYSGPVSIEDQTVGVPGLFNVAVEAKPGANVSLTLDGVSFTYPSGNCDVSVPSAHFQLLYSPVPYVMSAPGTCSGSDALALSLGTAATENVTGHKVEIIPVEIDQNITVEEMDLQLTLTDVQGTLDLVEFKNAQGIFPTNVESLGGGVYRLYAHFKANGSPSSFSSGTLFEIKLHRPSLDNVAVQAELNFDFARVHYATGACCSPSVAPGPGDAPYVVSVGSESYCGSDLLITMTPVTDPIGVASDCSSVPFAQYYVNLRNNSAQDISITFLELHVGFESDGNLSMDVQDDSNWWCTPGCSYDCFSSSGNTLIHLDCSSGKILHNAESMSFLVTLSGQQGTCVTGAYFRWAKIVYDDDLDPATPNVICAPLPENLPAEMYCARRMDGLIAREDGAGVDNVKVVVYGPDAPCNAEPLTGSIAPDCGVYELCTSCDGQHTLVPEKDDDIRCGVTTLDIVYILRHILQINLLDSPYKMIAADVNHSGSVSTFDLVAMQKVILLLENTFPNNTSWRFVDASYVFPDPTNPWTEPFPEHVNIDFSNGNLQTADFVAIKIGDVNLSCEGFCGANFQEPSDPDKAIVYLNNQGSYQAGDTIDLSFQVKNFSQFNSYQMGIGYDTDYLSYVDVHAADLSGVSAVEGDDFNVDVAGGQIRTLWYEGQGGSKTLNNGDALFRLRFTANAAVSDLNGIIWLADSILGSWAYDDSGVRHLFELQDEKGVSFNSAEGASVSSDEIASLKLSPNPFSQDVELSMLLQGSDVYDVELDLFDLSGRVIWNRKYELLSGKQNLVLPFGKLERGIYLLRLRCNDQISYHKLIRQ